MSKFAIRLKGIPAALLAVGAGFVMAASADLQTAAVMGATVFVSLLLSTLLMSLLGKIIPGYAKLPVYILVITGIVSLSAMLLQAYFPAAVETVEKVLGVQLAALALSLVAFKNTKKGQTFSVADALITGLLFVVLMALCGAIRELLGSAMILGKSVAFLEEYKMTTLTEAFGGYLVLSVAMALINKITGVNKEVKEDN